MSTSFSLQEPDEWVCRLLQKAIRQWHQRLLQAEVTFAVLMARNEKDAPLKVRGHKALACIRVVPYLWRVAGMPDVLLQIDSEEWESLDGDSQIALLDHELCHIDLKEYVLKPNDDGELVTTGIARDDCGRPKLVSVPGDWMGGDGFRVVVERHGAAAIECINAHRVADMVEAAQMGAKA